MKCQNTDRFPREVVSIFIDATNHVLDTLTFKAWDKETMKRCWRGRSLNDLLKNPEANHLFPCLDTALLATHYLASQGQDAYLKVLTEKGAVEAFKDGRARIMHIDSLAEINWKGKSYALDLGCGDITILTPIIPTEDEIPSEEVKYFTTRPEEGEQIWRRTPFLRLRGQEIKNNPDRSPLSFLYAPENLVKVPYCIDPGDFYRENMASGKPSIVSSNQEGYDPKSCSRYNEEWLDKNKDFLPGMRRFRYE
jgi:hypothetical protein